MNPMRRILILILLVILFLLGVDYGRSTAATPEGGWGQAYERAAIEYWHETPTSCTSESFHWDSPGPEKRTAALADTPVLGRANVTEGKPVPCNMWVAPLPGYGVYFRCILFAHEFGHWLGRYDEPSNPKRSVAYELLGSYTKDPPCRRLVHGETAELEVEEAKSAAVPIPHAPKATTTIPVYVTERGLERQE